MIPNSII